MKNNNGVWKTLFWLLLGLVIGLSLYVYLNWLFFTLAAIGLIYGLSYLIVKDHGWTVYFFLTTFVLFLILFSITLVFAFSQLGDTLHYPFSEYAFKVIDEKTCQKDYQLQDPNFGNCSESISNYEHAQMLIGNDSSFNIDYAKFPDCFKAVCK